jgi:hypothetical protein
MAGLLLPFGRGFPTHTRGCKFALAQAARSESFDFDVSHGLHDSGPEVHSLTASIAGMLTVRLARRLRDTGERKLGKTRGKAGGG